MGILCSFTPWVSLIKACFNEGGRSLCLDLAESKRNFSSQLPVDGGGREDGVQCCSPSWRPLPLSIVLQPRPSS